jgi:D-3-phosphoglycerate dehydrogenase
MRPKVLITDTVHDSLMPMLEASGFDPVYQPKISRAEILDGLHHYTGMIVRSKTPIDQELMASGPNLRFIARSGAGLDLIDIEYAEKRGIPILNAPEGNRDAVGEHTAGMILNLINKIRQGDSQVRHKVWDREGNRGIELMHMTVGIIGYGNMGGAVARRLKGFGCRIIAYDKYKTGFSDEWVEEVSFETIRKESDLLSFHIPLTDETRFYVDDEFIEGFTKNFILINTARGEIMRIATLLKHLETGKITAAGLDVLENEKMAKLSPEQDGVMQKLFKMDQVLFTPHVAGWTVESYVKINETLVRKIKALNLV